MLAILPVKSFSEAKQRLQAELSPTSRRSLCEAMLADVLSALREANQIDGILVVTADREAGQIATSHGARVLEAEERGHNPAAALGIHAAIDADAERVLLVPGDCPLLDPVDVDRLLERPVGARSVLIVPDRHGTGTNSLLLTPPDAIDPSFGPGSCERHIAAARSSASVPELVEVPSLALDVDTPDDLSALEEELATTGARAVHTGDALSQLTRTA